MKKKPIPEFMGKLIIDNRSYISDLHALELVKKIIKSGRVSNHGKQYCYLTVFEEGVGEVQVCTDLNKESDRFLIQTNE